MRSLGIWIYRIQRYELLTTRVFMKSRLNTRFPLLINSFLTCKSWRRGVHNLVSCQFWNFLNIYFQLVIDWTFIVFINLLSPTFVLLWLTRQISDFSVSPWIFVGGVALTDPLLLGFLGAQVHFIRGFLCKLAISSRIFCGPGYLCYSM